MNKKYCACFDGLKNEKEKEEFSKILAYLEDPNTPDTEFSWGLPENPTPLEMAKYQICEELVIFSNRSKITNEELANKLNISLEEMKHILLYHLKYLDLDKLLEYVHALSISLNVINFRHSSKSHAI